MSPTFAIDLGTTNSLVAEWKETINQPQLMALPTLSEPETPVPLIPSLVYVDTPERLYFGQTVRQRQLDMREDNRLFRNFKRAIAGQTAWPARTIDGHEWSHSAVATRFLLEIMHHLPDPTTIDQLILTVPIAAFETYLDWLQRVATQAGIAPERVRVVDESTAAALGYAVQEVGAPVLVIDFGGGTLDISLVRLPEKTTQAGGFLSFLRRQALSQHTAQVIAKSGALLGGSDIDQWLIQHILDTLGTSATALGEHYAPLLTQCEQLKITLSQEENVTLPLEIGQAAINFHLTRAEFGSILEKNGLFTALRRTLDQVMVVARHHDIYREDIQHVLLVGGTGLIPAIQDSLRDYFSAEVVYSDKVFTAVVEGALQLGAGVGLQDYIGRSYVLRYLDEHGQHQYEEIIPLGMTYPSQPVEIILQAAHDQQTAIELFIGEVAQSAVTLLEVVYEGNQAVFVAQANVDGQQIIPLNPDTCPRLVLDPVGEPGQDRLQARFHVDSQRQLHVTVIDLATRRTLLDNHPLIALL